MHAMYFYEILPTKLNACSVFYEVLITQSNSCTVLYEVLPQQSNACNAIEFIQCIICIITNTIKCMNVFCEI